MSQNQNQVYIPTELEIDVCSAKFFPENEELRCSFVMGIHNTINRLKDSFVSEE